MHCTLQLLYAVFRKVHCHWPANNIYKDGLYVDHPLYLHLWVVQCHLSGVCECVWERARERDDNVQPTESSKRIMKIWVASLTAAQWWSSEYYDCHYRIAKPTGHVTHQPTQTAHSKQHSMPCLTAHHCPLGGIWATANGLPLIIKVRSQMSRKYCMQSTCQTLTRRKV